MANQVDNLTREVCFELCRQNGEDPMSGCLGNINDIAPHLFMIDRVDSQGLFRWKRWEGYVPDAQRLINLIQKGSVYG
jgi:hypothetical protein